MVVFVPSAEGDPGETVIPCPHTAVVIVTYVYDENTDDNEKDAIPDLDGYQPTERSAAVFKYKFELEDQVELTLNTTSNRWAVSHLPEYAKYIARAMANCTTLCRITLHSCLRDRWIGLSEVFGSRQIFATGAGNMPSYQTQWLPRASAAVQQVGNLALTPILPAAGFVRDQFNIVASFNKCAETDEEDVLHPRFLMHDGAFNRTDTGIVEVLPDLPGNSQGGNVTISPPTPKHPYGAILMGIGRCWPRSSQFASYAKAVLQPIIPVDARLGSVQHTDEFVGFAGGPNNWKMVCASANLALQLVERLKGLRPGLLQEQVIPGCLLFPSNPSLQERVNDTLRQGSADFLLRERDNSNLKLGATCDVNLRFLSEQLGLAPEQVVEVPVLKALVMPNAANFIPANGGVVVPHQHSFRITAAEGNTIFAQLFDNTDLSPLIAQSTHIEFYAELAMTYAQVAGTYVAAMQVAADAMPAEGEDPLTVHARAIAGENRQLGEQIPAHSIVRIPCPADTCDLFEAYLFLLYRKLDIPLRFVISANLNRGGGNLHCASNYFPNFEAFPFASFPPAAQNFPELKAVLTNPTAVVDVAARDALKDELEAAIQELIAVDSSDDESDESKSDEGHSSDSSDSSDDDTAEPHQDEKKAT